MKISLALACGMLFTQLNGQSTLRVFFAGNEMTQAFNIPSLVQQLAASKGDSLYWQRSTPPGGTLTAHTTNTQTLGYLEIEQWDVVVFQEHPAWLGLSDEIFLQESMPSAEDLCQYTRGFHPCVKPAFFLPWGAKNGDTENCDEFEWVCTYAGLQDSLTARTRQLALHNDAWVIPVGESWRNALNFGDGSINLYGDLPLVSTLHGSYLAACTFYRTLYGSLSLGGWHPEGISALEAEFLQTIADGTVGLNEALWNLKPVVWADLLFDQAGIFTTISLDASAVVDSVVVTSGIGEQTWEVGDIGAQTLSPGWNYFLLDIYSACGNQLGEIDSVFIEGETAVQNRNAPGALVYPNPGNGLFTVVLPGDGPWQLSVIDLQGRIIMQHTRQGSGGTLDLTAMPEGVYLLRVTGGNRTYHHRIQRIR